MGPQLKYEDVEQYLRTFSTEAPPYTFGGLLRLVLAAVENLQKNGKGGEILENAHLLTDAQASFLQQLLETRAASIEWFKDYVAHSSQTGQL